jgi:hypothetical protein
MDAERRKSPRFRFEGEAAWKNGMVEHRRRLLDLSIGGVGIAPSDEPLPLGTRLAVTVVLESDLMLGPLDAEVVHHSESRVGLRFVNPSALLLQELQRLTDETPR